MKLMHHLTKGDGPEQAKHGNDKLLSVHLMHAKVASGIGL